MPFYLGIAGLKDGRQILLMASSLRNEVMR